MRIDIELLRIVSAVGIVWFHSNNSTGREVAYGGLVFFVIISTYFATVSRSTNKFKSRFKRLIIPYIIWSLLYAVLNFVGTGQICPHRQNLVSCILGTPSTHLWYLPYMFGVLFILDKIKSASSKSKMGTVSGILAIALILLAPLWRSQTYLSPFELYLHALPAVLYGVFLGCYDRINQKLRLFILSVISASVLVMIYVLPQGIGIPYLCGFLPSLLLIREDVLQKTKIDIYPISSLMYGVYLLHFAFFLVFWSLGINYYWLPVAVFLLSLFSVFAIKKMLPAKIHKYLI